MVSFDSFVQNIPALVCIIRFFKTVLNIEYYGQTQKKVKYEK